jgi:hypothetical protein
MSLTASALFRPRPNGRLASYALASFHSRVRRAHAPLHSDSRKHGETADEVIRARPKGKDPMAARLRPAGHGNTARGFACRRRHCNNREHGAFAPASQNTPTSLTKPSWSDTSPPGFSRNCRSRPFTLASQFSRSALSLKSRIRWLALARLRRDTNQQTRRRTLARGWLSRTSALR